MATLTKFGCPECQTVLQLAAPVPAGKMVKCPKCGASFAAPDASTPVNRLAGGSGQKRRWNHDDEDDADTSPRPKFKKKKLKKKQESGNKALVWGLVIGLGVLLVGGGVIVTVLLMGDGKKNEQLAANTNPPRGQQAPGVPAPAPDAGNQAPENPQPDQPGAGVGGAAAAVPPGIERKFNKPDPVGQPGGGLIDLPGDPRAEAGGPQPQDANPGQGAQGQGAGRGFMEEMMKRMMGGGQGQKPPADAQQGQPPPPAGGRAVGVPPDFDNMFNRPGGKPQAGKRPPGAGAAGGPQNPADGAGAGVAGGEGEGLEVGNTAPEIAGKDSAGKEFKLSDYRGKVVLIDFWGFW